MFHVICPQTGDALRGVEAIVEQANTPRGVVTAVSCRCGGQAILHRGTQVAHHTPGDDVVTPVRPSSSAVAA